MFRHGELRLYLLKLLEDGERHGYDLIRMLEDRLLGVYSPSAGTVYPRLQALVEEGLLERREVDGRKVYRLTEAGREELRVRLDEVSALTARAGTVARELVRDLKTSVRDMKTELKVGRRGAVLDVKLDLDAFVADILAAVRTVRPTAERLVALRGVLVEARRSALTALNPELPPGPDDPPT